MCEDYDYVQRGVEIDDDVELRWIRVCFTVHESTPGQPASAHDPGAPPHFALSAAAAETVGNIREGDAIQLHPDEENAIHNNWLANHV